MSKIIQKYRSVEKLVEKTNNSDEAVKEIIVKGTKKVRVKESLVEPYIMSCKAIDEGEEMIKKIQHDLDYMIKVKNQMESPKIKEKTSKNIANEEVNMIKDLMTALGVESEDKEMMEEILSNHCAIMKQMNVERLRDALPIGDIDILSVTPLPDSMPMIDGLYRESIMNRVSYFVVIDKNVFDLRDQLPDQTEMDSLCMLMANESVDEVVEILNAIS